MLGLRHALPILKKQAKTTTTTKNKPWLMEFKILYVIFLCLEHLCPSAAQKQSYTSVRYQTYFVDLN